MKNILLVLAIFALGSQAFCDECCYNWTGGYLGINAGGAWGDSKAKTTAPFNGDPFSYLKDGDFARIDSVGTFHIRPRGFIGGVQAGYNNQCLWRNLVWGIEGDFNSFHMRKSGSSTAFYAFRPTTAFTISQKISTDWLFTFRPRLGWACDKWLIFGTGGLAVSSFKYRGRMTDTIGASERSTLSETLTGWVAGAGIEYAAFCNFTLNVTYLHTHFGRVSTSGILSFSDPFFTLSSVINHSANFNANIVRFGINWRLP